jgi:hypothetical protein
VVQLDPIEPPLKAPGIKLLKLKYEELLSNFGCRFNLRRYTEAQPYYFFFDVVNGPEWGQLEEYPEGREARGEAGMIFFFGDQS